MLQKTWGGAIRNKWFEYDVIMNNFSESSTNSLQHIIRPLRLIIQVYKMRTRYHEDGILYDDAIFSSITRHLIRSSFTSSQRRKQRKSGSRAWGDVSTGEKVDWFVSGHHCDKSDQNQSGPFQCGCLLTHASNTGLQELDPTPGKAPLKVE